MYFYPEYLKNMLAETDLSGPGSLGTFTLKFNQGAAWNQQVYLVAELNFKPSEALVGDDLAISVDFQDT